MYDPVPRRTPRKPPSASPQLVEADASDVYRIGDISEQTGFSGHVLRVWERRHGLLAPTRSAGGQRLYSAEDLNVLLGIRALLAQGQTIGQIARMGRKRLLAEAERTLEPDGGLAEAPLENAVCAAALTEIPYAVIVTDPHGCTRWVNPAFTDLCGYTLSDVSGRSPGTLLQGPESDAATARRIGLAIREVRPSSERILNYDKRNRKYWVALDITPLWVHGMHEGFIGVARDLTNSGEDHATNGPVER